MLLLQDPKYIFNFLRTSISSKDSLILDILVSVSFSNLQDFLKYPKIVSYRKFIKQNLVQLMKDNSHCGLKNIILHDKQYLLVSKVKTFDKNNITIFAIIEGTKFIPS